MIKELISKQQYDFLLQVLTRHQQAGVLDGIQVEKILQSYEVKEKVNFIRVLVVIGSILIGLGVLSFIASNWIYLSKLTKFSLIVFSYLAVNVVGYRTMDKYPKTGRSFIYLGMLIFGAGIFLVGQMFNFGGNFTMAFLLWALGILPITLFLKDQLALIFINILIFIYLNGHFGYKEIPYILLIVVPVLYYLQKLFESKIALFFTNFLVLNIIVYLAYLYNLKDEELVILAFFIIGLLLYLIPIPYYQSVFKLQGIIIFGISGLLLTIDFFGEDIFGNMLVLFDIFYVLLLLYLVRQESLLALLFLGITIFRFYVDTMYDFLDKSIFFLVGGALLLAFGFYFERKRHKLRGAVNEK